MEFEHIVVIIAVIWYIISLLKKKKPVPKKTAKSGKDTKAKRGVMSHLGDKIKEAVKELERQAAQAQAKQKAKTGSGEKSDEWDRFLAKDEELQWEDETDSEVEDWEEETVFDRPEKHARVSSAPDEDQKKSAPVTHIVSTSPSEASFAPETLRNAIIWSEILAPPLALRDEGEHLR